MSLGPETAIGAVRLAVVDLDVAREFYERVIGLRVLEAPGGLVRLGGDEAVVELAAEPGAPQRPRRSTGLFHLAILVPDRTELARSLRRVVDAGWRLAGASDHLVSEALYLADPEGNGIEVYRDRPREQWRYAAGRLEMATLPLDLRSVLGEVPAEGEVGGPTSPRTTIGHVHLQVSDLASAEDFYAGTLGFEVTVRDYPGALFLSAGGYHHHIGVNTWAGEGGPPPAAGSRGLRWFEVMLPEAGELDAVAGRLRDRGYDSRREGGSLLTSDPSSNGVLIRVAEP